MAQLVADDKCRAHGLFRSSRYFAVVTVKSNVSEAYDNLFEEKVLVNRVKSPWPH